VITKHFSKLSQKLQYILFSATYSDEIKKDISTFIAHAQQISIKKEHLQLEHI
jgi:superfamily II DNA/RNA helicase